MENKNLKASIYTYIAVVTLILLAGGATYAYFASTRNIESNIAVEANVLPGSYVFMASANGNIGLNVTPNMMGESNQGEVASDSKILTVSLESPNEQTKTTCTYDIVWEWTGTDRYTTHTPGNTQNEFTVAVNEGLNETNISNLTLIDNKIVLVNDAQVVSMGQTNTIAHNVNTKIYNINADQTLTLAGTTGKSFQATVTVDQNSINCIMEPYETTTVNLGSVAISSGGNQNVTMIVGNNTLAHKLLSDNVTNSGLVKNTVYGNMFRYQSNVDRTCSTANDTCKKFGDNYFYTEDNTNNYVCFGYTNTSDCTGANKDDYLYRIIGIDKDTKEVQVIKATSLKEGSTTNFKYHNAQVATDWGAGMTNPQADISKRLNGQITSEMSTATYQDYNGNSYNLSNLFVNSTQYPYMAESSGWYNKISSHNWKSGADSTLNTYNGNTAYTKESSFALTSSMKIGLLNASDVFWSYTGGNPGSKENNRNSWLYSEMGSLNSVEWAAHRYSTDFAWRLYGYVSNGGVGLLDNGRVNGARRVRPTFFLKPDITYVSGTGVKSNPFIVF